MTKLKRKIDRLGYYAPLSYAKFTRIRFLTTLFLFIYLLFIIEKYYFYAPLITILYYNLFRVILVDWPLNFYVSRYERDSLQFFELVSLAVSKGMNIEMSLESTAKYFNCDLSYAYIAALIEVKFGKSLVEAVNDMEVPSQIVKEALVSLMNKDMHTNKRMESVDKVVLKLKENMHREMRKRIKLVPIQTLLLLLIVFVPLMLLIVYAKDIVMLFN